MKKIMLAVVVGTFLFGAAMAGMNNYEPSDISVENFLIREYTFDEPEITEENGYAVVSMQDTKSMMHEGKPVLPYKVDVMRFPTGTKVSIEAQEGKIMEKELNSKVKPYPMFTLATTKGKLVIKEGEIYGTNEAYPENWVDYRVTVGLYNGERVVTLSIFMNPCRYIPSENKIIYTNQIKVKVNYEPPSSLPFVNDEYDLLIICPDKWIDALQTLKEHKESHGIRTVIAGLNEIYTGKYFSAQGRDSAEKIKYFIKSAIEKYGIKYVMLVGDVEEMPVRYVSTVIGEVPCDLYFADIYSSNGSFSSWDRDNDKIYGEKLDDRPDLYPDVHIGRLPAGDENELNLLIDKIMNYSVKERNALMTGVELFWDTDNREGEYLKEEISKEMNIEVIKLYETDEYEKDGSANSYNIAKYINNGVMMVNFAAHGSPYGMGWESGHFVIDDLSLLHNSYLPIVFAMSCSTNEFDTTDCLGEKFLTYENGGAIAYAGSSRVAYVYLGKSIKSSLSGYLDTAFFRAYYDGFNKIGEIFSEAKIDYLTRHVFRNEHDYLTLIEYNLMGDPTIEIPFMPETSKAYVSKSKSNSEIKIWAEISEENISDASVDLYYRKKVMWGGRWYLYDSKDSPPYEWKFLPDEEGLYEFYTVLRKENYTEFAPRVADAYCIFDFSYPYLNITKPEEGGIYVFNREILSTKTNFTVIIGKIEVQAEGDVEKMEFYVDGRLMHIDYDAPFKWTWDEFSFGRHEIKVIGYDAIDNMAEDKIGVISVIL